MLEFKNDTWRAVIALLLPMGLLAVFTFWPIVNAVRMAFMNGYTMWPGEYNGIGIDNFIQIVSPGEDGLLAAFSNDNSFWASLLNTFYIVIITVPLTIIIGLMIAVGLNSIKKLQKVYQTIFFLPYVTNTIALGLVFSALFSRYGIINSVFGLDISWVGSNATKFTGIFVLAVYSVWNGLAFKIIVFLSGMQGIDKQYYQAAQIDSATKWQTFRKITVPLLSPMILYITITSFIGAFKTYSSVVSIFGTGSYGPGSNPNLLRTVVGYIYDQMTPALGQPIGLGAAGSLILFGIIMLITLVQMQVSKKRVHY